MGRSSDQLDFSEELKCKKKTESSNKILTDSERFTESCTKNKYKIKHESTNMIAQAISVQVTMVF